MSMSISMSCRRRPDPGRSLLVVTGLLLAGCPAQVEHRYGEMQPRPVAAADENDPRVIKDGEDLYPAAVVERAEGRTRGEASDIPGRGSGKPDESNGVCRLYAPKLADPHCCEPEFGFDAKTVLEACDVDMYLGESWHKTCGYHFHKPDGTSTWFRASFIAADGARAAADSQARQLAKIPNASAQVTKVPGTKDAWWVTHEDLGWAYFGGWDKTRQFAWDTGGCSPEGVARIIAAMETATQPPPDAERLGLVPEAR
jgi:hypothetical protein